jgi:S-DNA-T family DNA segregation ATPase FtsK/SpoIIIE
MTIVATTSTARLDGAFDRDPVSTVIDLASIEPGTPLGALSAGDQGAGHVVVIGTPDAWQSRWSLLTAARSRSDLVVHGCGVAEFRALTGLRALPPPLSDPVRDAWCLEPGGSLARIRLGAPPRS